MQQDELTIEITETGTIKVTTSKVSAANHINAEDFLKLIARLGGGQTTRTRRGDVHTHRHTHDAGEHNHG